MVIEPFNGTRPIGPYASVHFIEARPYQHEVYDYEERDGEYHESLRGERYCRVRLMFFTAGAMRTAIDCQNRLRSTNRLFDMAPITGFGEIGQVQDISGVFGAKFEDRAVFLVELYANMSAAYPSTWIRNVPGDINGGTFLVDNCPQANAGA